MESILELPPLERVALIYDGFSQVLERPKGETESQLAIIWRAWVYNPHDYMVRGQYFVEFRDLQGSLLDLYGPIRADFTPTPDFPREANGIYWPNHYVWSHVDLAKSRVYITLE